VFLYHKALLVFEVRAVLSEGGFSVSIATNKETARRFIEEVFNRDPSPDTDEFAAQDYLVHDPDGNTMRGMAKNKAIYRSGSPHMTITHMLGEEDLVAVHWTASGTHQQPLVHLHPELAQLPATGKTTTTLGMILLRFEDSKIVEVWRYWDNHHLLKQLSAE
jgi:predicted SnoaL-like aldol condensation-catalyzing enzyme